MADRLSEAPRGSNLTPESFIELYREWRTNRRTQKEGSSAVSNTKKKMKGIGVDLRAFDMMEKLNDMDSDEAVTMLKTVIRYGNWCGMPFATQEDLFAGLAIEQPTEKAKAEISEMRTFDEGHFVGREGGERKANPHPAGTPFFVAWDNGYIDGMAVIAKRMGALSEKDLKKQAAKEAAANGTGKPAGGKRGSKKKDQDAAQQAASEQAAETVASAPLPVL